MIATGQRNRSAARLVVALTLLFSSLVSGATTASAATITVTSNANDGLGSLRQAISMAVDGDTINFDPALFGDTITLVTALSVDKDLTIIGLGISALTIATLTADGVFQIFGGATVTLSDMRLSSTGGTVEANGSGDLSLDRVNVFGGFDGIEFDSPGADLRLSGTFVDTMSQTGIDIVRAADVVLTNSTARDNGSYGLRVADDGATQSDVGSITLVNSDISRNTASGLEITGITGDLSITDSFIEDNEIFGVVVEGGVGGDVEVVDSSVTGNSNAGGAFHAVAGDVRVSASDFLDTAQVGLSMRGVVGGGVSISNSTFTDNGLDGVSFTGINAPLTITGSTFARNTLDGLTTFDGVGNVVISDSTATSNGSNGFSITDVVGDVTVSDATASSNGTSGISVDESVTGNVTIRRVVVDGNQTGLFLSDIAGPVTVTDTTSSNSSDDGVLADANPGGTTLERVTISGAPSAVVGLISGALTIVNSTLTGNATSSGDDTIFVSMDSLAIRHSTVTGNGAAGSNAPLVRANPGVDITVDHSIVTGNRAARLTAFSGSTTTAPATFTNSLVPVGSNVGASNIEVVDPLVAPLANNGGTTQSMAPLTGSPAIGAGNATITGAPTTDQRGAARVVSTIDIGAVETQTADAITTLAPERFVDSRSIGDTFDNRFQAEGRRNAGSEYRVQMTGRGGVPDGAKAVVINVTAVGASASGFVTVHPCVSPLPVASSLNYTSGVNLPNEIVAPLTAGGELCLFTSQAIHLLVDVVGFVDARSPLVPVTPSRYLDTRANGTTFDDVSLGAGRTGAGTTTTVRVAGRGSVPADAAAVVVNVTAVGAQAAGFVTVHPCLPTAPNASSLNHVAGVNRANELLASVDDSGDICLLTSRSIHLVVDVVGYLPADSSYQPIAPARFLDTRPNGTTVDAVEQRAGKPAAGDQVELQIAGRPGVPENAKAAVINVTAASPDTRGFVTVHPCVSPPPNASSLNYVAGVNGANELIASLTADGKVCLFTSQSTHLIVDVVGYLT